MKYGKQPILKKIASSRITFILALLVFVFLLRTAWNMAEKSATAGDRLALSEAAYERLSLRHDSLAAKVDYLSTSEGVESEIRTKFRAVEEGESVAVIVSDPGVKADISSSTSRAVTKRSWWQKIAGMFGL